MAPFPSATRPGRSMLQRSRALSSADGILCQSNSTGSCRASTEPRSFERGWSTSAKRSAARTPRFNGAALFRARMELAAEQVEAAEALLQRSRALSSADGWVGGLPPGGGVDASTEPRSFERGWSDSNRLPFTRSRASTEPRSFERGWEISGSMACRSVGASTEPRSFERGWGDMQLELVGDAYASTEPRSFERGWKRSKRPSAPRVSRFNGAALFRARMDSRQRAALPLTNELQRSRALSSADGRAWR